MTPAAWIMLAVTWSVVIFFTARFFWLVLTKPHVGGGDPAEPESS